MKVKIDGVLCTGHGRCAVLAGEVYELDDDGYNAERGKAITVDPGDEDAARLGAEVCPEAAIGLVDE